MMSIIIIPWILDISWLGQLLIPYMFPLSSLVNWALAALGRFERRRLEKQLDDLENEE